MPNITELSPADEYFLQRFKSKKKRSETDLPYKMRLFWRENGYPPYSVVGKAFGKSESNVGTIAEKFGWPKIRERTTDLEELEKFEKSKEAQDKALKNHKTITEFEIELLVEDIKYYREQLKKDNLTADDRKDFMKQIRLDTAELKHLKFALLRGVNLPEKILDKQRYEGETTIRTNSFSPIEEAFGSYDK